MKMSIIAAGTGLLFLPPFSVLAQVPHPTSPTNEAHYITQSYETSEEASDGSSGSSKGSDTLLERVIAQRAGGVELEYDLPVDTTAEDRARNWQLPARVLRMDGGRMQLLNSGELEDRLAVWLKAANWDRSVCGRLIFTWNAFGIECDPQAIIRQLEEIDLSAQDLRDGASYLDARAGRAGRLARSEGASNGTKFSVAIR